MHVKNTSRLVWVGVYCIAYAASGWLCTQKSWDSQQHPFVSIGLPVGLKCLACSMFDGAACSKLQAPDNTLSAGIGLILGLNGAIWVSTQQHQTTAVPSGAAAAHGGLAQQQQKVATMLTKEERSRVVRVATCIRALARLYLLVHPATILETFQVGWAQMSDDHK